MFDLVLRSIIMCHLPWENMFCANTHKHTKYQEIQLTKIRITDIPTQHSCIQQQQSASRLTMMMKTFSNKKGERQHNKKDIKLKAIDKRHLFVQWCCAILFFSWLPVVFQGRLLTRHFWVTHARRQKTHWKATLTHIAHSCIGLPSLSAMFVCFFSSF